MRFGNLSVAVLCLSAFLLSPLARADFFTSQAAFNAVNPGLPVLTFEGIAAPGTSSQAPTFPGVTFTNATTGSSNAVNIASSSFFFNTPTDVLFLNVFTDPLTLTFAPTISAVGFNVVSGDTGGLLTLTVFNGATLLDTEVVTTTGETDFTTFTGFSNLGDITSLTITPQIFKFVLIDNLAFGIAAPAAVPEPGSIAFLTGLSLTGAAFLRRRKQSQKAA